MSQQVLRAMPGKNNRTFSRQGGRRTAGQALSARPSAVLQQSVPLPDILDQARALEDCLPERRAEVLGVLYGIDRTVPLVMYLPDPETSALTFYRWFKDAKRLMSDLRNAGYDARLNSRSIDGMAGFLPAGPVLEDVILALA